MGKGSDGRLTFLQRKAREGGLSDAEVRELADLERGGPPVPGPGFRHPSPPARPWQLRQWRNRSLGPIGGVVAVALVVVAVAVIFLRRPALTWSVYGDRHVGFRLDYPEDWVIQDLSGQGSGGGGVVGVAVMREGSLPADYRAVLAPPFPQPLYGLMIVTGPPGDPGSLLAPFLQGADGTAPTEASVGGLRAKEVVFVTGGAEARTTYATDAAGRLVVFFSRIPSKDVATVHDVIDHARESVEL